MNRTTPQQKHNDLQSQYVQPSVRKLTQSADTTALSCIWVQLLSINVMQVVKVNLSHDLTASAAFCMKILSCPLPQATVNMLCWQHLKCWPCPQYAGPLCGVLVGLLAIPNTVAPCSTATSVFPSTTCWSTCTNTVNGEPKGYGKNTCLSLW